MKKKHKFANHLCVIPFFLNNQKINLMGYRHVRVFLIPKMCPYGKLKSVVLSGEFN